MSIGIYIDKLFKLDQEIDKLTALKAAVEKKREALADQIMVKFKKQDLNGGIGKLGMLTVEKREFPSIENPEEFYKYVIKKKATDLLQKRIAVTAYRDRIEAGEKVPGVKTFTKTTLRVTKRKAKH